MVQILEAPESFGRQFATAIGKGATEGYENAMTNRKKLAQLKNENEAIRKETGIDLRGIEDPDQRKAVFSKRLEAKTKENEIAAKHKKDKGDLDLENESYGNIKNYFGEKFANVWKAAPTGGRTELLKQGIEARSRGIDIDELLQGVKKNSENKTNDSLKNINEPNSIVNELVEENIKTPQMRNGKIPKEFQWPDYLQRPEGYTQKEWIDEKRGWRKENVPDFVENKTQLQAAKRNIISTKKLSKLNESEKLPEDWERSLINPSTGEPYGLAQITQSMSPETQEWIKEIARFGNRAKDAFGSRVTNFDLVTYMKQFPSLLNTPEGRKRILNMMRINYEMDDLYAEAKDQVYKKYGLSGISLENADKLAQSLIQEDIDRLSNEYLINEDEIQLRSQEDQEGLSGRMVDVVGPNGEIGEVDERQVDQLPEGYRIK